MVVDASWSIERELIDQQTFAERNAVTHACLAEADQVIGICMADNIGIARYTWAIQELKQLGHAERLMTLVTKAPATQRSIAAIEQTLQRLAGISVHAYLADDPTVFAKAAEVNLPIALAPRNSSVKQAIGTFVKGQLLGLEVRKRRLAKLG